MKKLPIIGLVIAAVALFLQKKKQQERELTPEVNIPPAGTDAAADIGDAASTD